MSDVKGQSRSCFSSSREFQNTFLHGATFSICVLYFIISHQIEATYHLILLEARLSAIEKSFNHILDADVLHWDSKIIPRFSEVGNWMNRGWVNPSHLLGVSFCGLFALLSVAHIALFCFAVPISPDTIISGYRFIYPDFRSGYAELIRSFKEVPDH